MLMIGYHGSKWKGILHRPRRVQGKPPAEMAVSAKTGGSPDVNYC